MELKEYLKKNNMNIKEFALKLDYTRSHMSRIVNGRVNPSDKIKRQISKLTEGEVTFD